jgi:hypothetical protein
MPSMRTARPSRKPIAREHDLGAAARLPGDGQHAVDHGSATGRVGGHEPALDAAGVDHDDVVRARRCRRGGERDRRVVHDARVHAVV